MCHPPSLRLSPPFLETCSEDGFLIQLLGFTRQGNIDLIDHPVSRLQQKLPADAIAQYSGNLIGDPARRQKSVWLQSSLQTWQDGHPQEKTGRDPAVDRPEFSCGDAILHQLLHPEHGLLTHL